MTPERKSWVAWLLAAVETLVVLAIALAARWLYQNPWVHPDEYLHLLSARSLLADGSLQLTPGSAPYTRSVYFTRAVAWCYEMFGDSLASARAPALLSGGLLVAAVFACLRHEAGRGPAWIAAGLLTFSLPALQWSQAVRFYMPHALAVWIMAWAGYRLVRIASGAAWRGSWLRHATAAAAWLLVFLLASLAAAHLQLLTVLPAAALGAWACGVAAVIAWRRWRWAGAGVVMGIIAVSAIASLVSLEASGYLDYLRQRQAAPRPWAEAVIHDYLYYHRQMLEWRPLLYVLLPVAAVTAARVRPWLATWALALCVLPALALSGPSAKADRYFLFVLPFFYAVWGVALAAWVRGLSAAVVSRLPIERRGRGARAAVAAVWCVVLGLPVAMAAEYAAAAAGLQGRVTESPYQRASVAMAMEDLRPWLAHADAVIGSPPLPVYHAAGRIDAILEMTPEDGFAEYDPDPIYGIPQVNAPRILARIRMRSPRGLIILEGPVWRDGQNRSRRTTRYILVHMEPVYVDPAARVVAFRWGEGWPEALTSRARETEPMPDDSAGEAPPDADTGGETLQ